MPATYPAPTLPKRQHPWLAVNLSLLFPGFGQLYRGEWKLGLLLCLSFAGLLGRGIWSIFAASGDTVRGLWLIGLAMVVYGFSLFHAYETLATAPDSSPVAKHRGSKPKDAWYSVFLSQLLPGLGHLYLEKSLTGGFFLLIGIGLAYWANNDSPALIPLAYGVWAIAGYHTYRIATDRKHPRLIIVLLVGLMLTRMIVGYAPTLVSRSLVQCIVPTESMVPTLQIRDRIFVKRDSLYRPQANDIVVFRAPTQAIAQLDSKPETLYVKRIIALPGQQVAIQQGQVWVNQAPFAETPQVQSGTYDWGPEVVPLNAYFVLGDNRDQSADSHVWGFLPKADLLGRAYKIYWPPDRVGSLLVSS
jgi:signal peptidase I